MSADTTGERPAERRQAKVMVTVVNEGCRAPDHERIWLEPRPGGWEEGRLWCKDDVWSGDPDYAQDGPPTEYIRKDLHEAAVREAARRVEDLLRKEMARLWTDLPRIARREALWEAADLVRKRKTLSPSSLASEIMRLGREEEMSDE